ncbi:MAG: hypothetical protein NT031_18585 [Planctomycetota bacterium]|nr:hypothetical protein [Planctomycetota bacterium]
MGVLVWAGLAFLARSAAGATTNPLEGIRDARQIAGPDFQLTQARGRVIVLLYWGINSADSKGALATLAAVQSKYATDKRVVVVASHVQTMNADVREFLKSLHPPFPVFQGLEIPGSPAGEEIPSALLFTHTGAMTAQGEIKSLLPRVPRIRSRSSRLASRVAARARARRRAFSRRPARGWPPKPNGWRSCLRSTRRRPWRLCGRWRRRRPTCPRARGPRPCWRSWRKTPTSPRCPN